MEYYGQFKIYSTIKDGVVQTTTSDGQSILLLFQNDIAMKVITPQVFQKCLHQPTLSGLHIRNNLKQYLKILGDRLLQMSRTISNQEEALNQIISEIQSIVFENIQLHRVQQDIMDQSLLDSFIEECKDYLFKFTQLLDFHHYEQVLNSQADQLQLHSLCQQINTKVRNLSQILQEFPSEESRRKERLILEYLSFKRKMSNRIQDIKKTSTWNSTGQYSMSIEQLLDAVLMLKDNNLMTPYILELKVKELNEAISKNKEGLSGSQMRKLFNDYHLKLEDRIQDIYKREFKNQVSKMTLR